jgi:large subunit ribosomal protein L21
MGSKAAEGKGDRACDREKSTPVDGKEKFGCRPGEMWHFVRPSRRQRVLHDRCGAPEPLTRDNIMAYAIFKTGGKQYKASVGDTVDVEKLEVAEGETASFDQVLAAGEGASLKIGAPVLEGASVGFKVVKQFKAPKVTAFKFKKRKGYHKTKGHRQPLTRVEVTSINA